MDITEFVDSSLRISPASEYAVTEDELLDIIDCLQNSTFYGDKGATIEERSTSTANAPPPSAAGMLKSPCNSASATTATALPF